MQGLAAASPDLLGNAFKQNTLTPRVKLATRSMAVSPRRFCNRRPLCYPFRILVKTSAVADFWISRLLISLIGMPWFRKKKGKIEPVSDKDRVVRTENVFVRCEECGEHLYKKELEEALQVCVHCNYHFRLGAYDRLEQLFDDAHCEELDAEVVSTDPLKFR